MNELTKQEQSSIVNVDFDQESKKLIKSTLLPGCTDVELDLFCQVCKRSKLDPFQRQITAFISKDDNGNRKLTFVTTVDGYRGIAERSGAYEGQTAPQWCDDKGKWTDIWLQDKPPFAAKIGAYKKGCREPFWGVARFSSFAKYGKGSDGKLYLKHNWKNMSDHMLAKVAETHALRKAFPNDLSGIYTFEEIEDDPNFKNASNVREYPSESKPVEKTVPVIQNHPKEVPQNHPVDAAGIVETLKEKWENFLSVMEFSEVPHDFIIEQLKKGRMANAETALEQLSEKAKTYLVTEKWTGRILELWNEKKSKETATK